MDKFERRINAIMENLPDEIEAQIRKKPHKCPVCYGISKLPKILHDDKGCNNLNPHSVWNMCMTCKGALANEYEDCYSCKGKGIVWE